LLDIFVIFINTLSQGYENIPKMQEPPQNSRCWNGDMKQVHLENLQILGATVQNLVSVAA